MTLARLTLQQIKDLYQAELGDIFSISTPLLPNSVVEVLSTAWAGGDHLLYGFIEDKAKQAIPDTADTIHLERWAEIWGITRKAADFAKGLLDFTGIDTTDIPAGSVVRRDDEAEFLTDSLVTISGGVAQVLCTSTSAGIAGNTGGGTIMELSVPIAGIDPPVTVEAGGLTGGSDEETDSALRARLLLRIQNPPQGGSQTDFEQWTLQVSGITRAFIFPTYLGNPGDVGVTAVEDGNPISIIPNAAKIQEIVDLIEPLRPITSNVIVFAPVAKDFDVTVQISPDTPEIRAAITAELDDMLRRDGRPGDTIFLSRVNEAISIAAGEQDHNLTFPVANVTHLPAEIPVSGIYTYSPL